jgi:V8-like Glu-specific endopeptidase
MPGKSQKRILDSFMAQTNGGGSAEAVPGFDLRRALTSGFATRRMAGPTILAARPDGGYFSDSAPSGDAVVAVSTPKPENVIGVDNRIRITETVATPWRCICQLEIEYDSGPVGLGTGFLIGKRAVATAAHVLVDTDFARRRVRRAKQVRVIPGRNGAVAPYGYVVSDKFERPDEWESPLDDEAAAARSDYAVIILPEEDLQGGGYGERIGFFGLEVLDNFRDEDRNFLLVNNAGYPLTPNRPYGTLWYNAGRIHGVDDHFVEYMIDTEGGQSGSPIYYFDAPTQQRRVIGIHTTGDFVNRGLKVTDKIFDTIKGWAGR